MTGVAHLYQGAPEADFYTDHHLQSAVALSYYVRQHLTVHDSKAHHCYASAQPVNFRNMKLYAHRDIKQTHKKHLNKDRPT